jgi:hypothetical protein
LDTGQTLFLAVDAKMENEFIRLMGQKILRHKNNWKDNPNKYTSLIFDLAPCLNPRDRKKLNLMLKSFSQNNFGIRPTTAEEIIYQQFTNPILRRQKIIFTVRDKSQSSQFDQMQKTIFDSKRAEQDLRNIAFFCLICFKDLVQKTGVTFDNDQFTISDIKAGATKIL